MSETEDTQIVVRIGTTVHQMSKILPHDSSIKLNLEVYFTYDEEEVINLFFQTQEEKQHEQKLEKEEFRKNFKFPFLISNASQIDYYSYWSSYKFFNSELENNFKNYHNDHRNINGFRPDRTPQDKETEYHQDNGIEKKDFTKRFKLEKFMITCELEVYNFTQKIPFNEVYIPVKILTNGGPNSNKILFRFEQISKNLKWEWSKKILNQGHWSNFLYSCNYKCIKKFDCIATRIIKLKDGNKTLNKKYDRIYFLRIYRFNFWEDVVKYYLIPCLLTITVILFYEININEFSGFISTIILGDIALLFIEPETNTFTYNERSIQVNIGFVFLLTLLKFINVNIHIPLFSAGVIILLLANFIHNYIDSFKFFKDIRQNLIKDGKGMADFDRQIYGGFQNCRKDNHSLNDERNSPPSINSIVTQNIEDRL